MTKIADDRKPGLLRCFEVVGPAPELHPHHTTDYILTAFVCYWVDWCGNVWCNPTGEGLSDLFKSESHLLSYNYIRYPAGDRYAGVSA